MNAKEMRAALELAQSSADLSKVDDAPLFGCGLPDWVVMQPTIEQVAKLVRWQCQYFMVPKGSTETWDWREYNDNMVPIMRRKFTLQRTDHETARELLTGMIASEMADVMQG